MPRPAQPELNPVAAMWAAQRAAEAARAAGYIRPLPNRQPHIQPQPTAAQLAHLRSLERQRPHWEAEEEKRVGNHRTKPAPVYFKDFESAKAYKTEVDRWERLTGKRISREEQRERKLGDGSNYGGIAKNAYNVHFKSGQQ